MKKYELIKPLKEEYKKYIQSLSVLDILSSQLSGKTVRLFHGTTTAYLNNILSNGILPRNKTNHHNWDYNPSIENIVYLTNKWHYFYAFNATDAYMNKKYGDNYTNNPEYHWWSTFETLPCYLECHVPVELLIPDEDFFFSNYALKKFKSSIKNGREFTLDYQESLSHYGTVGVIGGVKPKYIYAFTVLGDTQNLFNHFILPNTLYYKEYQAWQQGKGKGKLKLIDLMKMEEKSLLNGTWYTKDVSNMLITRFGINPQTQRISIQVMKK